MSSARVFVTRRIPEVGLDILAAAAESEVWPGEMPPPREVLLEKVRDLDGLLSLLTDLVDDELLDAAGPRLRVVSNFAVGYDNIDVPACVRRGIAVGNTPGVLTETTADLAFALLMAVARRLPEARDLVREDRWQTWGPLLLLGKDLHGATLGLVGFGRIGREMARRATGFGMRTLYHDVVPAEPEVERSLNASQAPSWPSSPSRTS
jgi:glyoxylate reductase